MRDIRIGALVFLTALIWGCKSDAADEFAKFSRMGDKAPALNSTPALAAPQSFIVGYWTVEGQTSPGRDGVIDPIYEIRADGTFTVTEYTPRRVLTGKITPLEKGFSVEYLTLDSKPIRQVMDEARAKAETGTQGALATDIFLDWLNDRLNKMNYLQVTEDGKHLEFIKQPDAGSELGFSFALETLERLNQDKPGKH